MTLDCEQQILSGYAAAQHCLGATLGQGINAHVLLRLASGRNSSFSRGPVSANQEEVPLERGLASTRQCLNRPGSQPYDPLLQAELGASGGLKQKRNRKYTSALPSERGIRCFRESRGYKKCSRGGNKHAVN